MGKWKKFTFPKKLRKPRWILTYFPWAFKMPTAITTPQTAPIKNDPELTASAHNVAAAPVSVEWSHHLVNKTCLNR